MRRHEQLTARYRRIFVIALGISVAAHVAALGTDGLPLADFGEVPAEPDRAPEAESEWSRAPLEVIQVAASTPAAERSAAARLPEAPAPSSAAADAERGAPAPTTRSVEARPVAVSLAAVREDRRDRMTGDELARLFGDYGESTAGMSRDGTGRDRGGGAFSGAGVTGGGHPACTLPTAVNRRWGGGNLLGGSGALR